MLQGLASGGSGRPSHTFDQQLPVIFAVDIVRNQICEGSDGEWVAGADQIGLGSPAASLVADAHGGGD